MAAAPAMPAGASSIIRNMAKARKSWPGECRSDFHFGKQRARGLIGIKRDTKQLLAIHRSKGTLKLARQDLCYRVNAGDRAGETLHSRTGDNPVPNGNRKQAACRQECLNETGILVQRQQRLSGIEYRAVLRQASSNDAVDR